MLGHRKPRPRRFLLPEIHVELTEWGRSGLIDFDPAKSVDETFADVLEAVRLHLAPES